MNEISISKSLAYLLRHKPEKFGIVLTKFGEAKTSEVLTALSQHHKTIITEEILADIVNSDTKKRYIMTDGLIRATQGHSINVKLRLERVTPPEFLFHGTVAKSVPSITQQGLLKGNRQYVHLSENVETATIVAKRRGEPVILIIKALEAHQADVSFYLSENQVWLVDELPTQFIELPTTFS